jgi:hypothetical protein
MRPTIRRLNAPSRRHLLASAVALAGAPLAACGGDNSSNQPAAATRRWRLGFSPNPPRASVASVLQGIELWSRRAELAIIHVELPWTELLAGMTADALIDRDTLPLVQVLRGKGLELIYMGDLNDGLSRGQDAPQLRAAGRSITESAVQALYRNYMLAVDRKLAPALLGLAAETNLIRAAAPGLYPAVKQAANDTAAALRAAGSRTPLIASVQVETAWNRLGTAGNYVGIETDFADFPFIETLGLSSYPYFGWPEPEVLPLDYYQRLRGGRTLPLMVVEGGWASASAGSITSSPDKQARYVTRHAQLLDNAGASAWLHLQFADVDLSALPPPVPVNLPLFASIGLADSNFVAKPSLAAWDALFARRLVG